MTFLQYVFGVYLKIPYIYYVLYVYSVYINYVDFLVYTYSMISCGV